MPDVLNIGESAPDFALTSNHGEVVTLQQFRGTPTLVFFYPADFSPVCTAEVCAFRDDYESFLERGVQVIGISPDSPERHKDFADRYNIPFLLLSDEDMEAANAFGARGLLGIRRAYFLIDQEGILQWQYSELLPIFRLQNEDLLQKVDELASSDVRTESRG